MSYELTVLYVTKLTKFNQVLKHNLRNINLMFETI